ncbi:MIF4G/MA3 domains containing protein [Babesia bovis T2Bo]|uniref:MIF4G/MA3 domains containing protein n=1 Tax=Babesia bovis TaxID=5865 RepID=A7AR43_BABBO|nr:MIF4G/MA3 domains containing protein [Babesia bovis T2Bo]EDO07012.1 MIF4G/MA3 domains containing protein [Babesia bovis T2Bo]|eukprot:XP_001610580.1 MIF4G/MA3 domains containing protein [Babesia bovis T2Bo]
MAVSVENGEEGKLKLADTASSIEHGAAKLRKTDNVNAIPSKGLDNDHVGADAVDKGGVNPGGRLGGIYIPPFKLVRLQREVAADGSIEYQRQEWDKLKKKINAIVNKLTCSNVSELVLELLDCNLIRGRGLFARSWIRAQMASPGFTDIYVSFLAVINSKFPEIGNLILRRIILQFRRAFRKNDRILCQTVAKSLAHLVNYRVAHEVLALQFLAILLENPTDDSVSVAAGFLEDVGNFLAQEAKQALEAIFDRFKQILSSGKVDKKTQYTIEALWRSFRNKFSDHPAVKPELDLVELEDSITHDLDFLDDTITADEMLNVFKPVEPEVYIQEQEKWTRIRRQLMGDSDDGSDTHDSDSSVDSEAEQHDEDQSEDKPTTGATTVIRDSTGQDLVNLRKTVYLCIMSSLNYEECVHKLLKLNVKEGTEIEICTMLIDCCAMERTFQPFYALQAERLSKLSRVYAQNFQECFAKQYQLIHRLETAKLRNVAKFFTHLLATDALPWSVLSIITLTESATTSSGRIFIKIMLQELCHTLGIRNLSERLHDPELVPHLSGIFPHENQENIRFASNFLTAIGLGALTTELRKRLK